MPFSVNGNETYLTITQVFQDPEELFGDANDLEYIYVYGDLQLNEPFTNNELLVKGHKLYFSNCLIDLNTFNGQWDLIQLSECILVGQLNEKVNILCLDARYSKISTNQINFANINQLKVLVEEQQSFEFMLQVKSDLKIIQAHSQFDVDVNNWIDQWDIAYFENCTFIGSVLKDSLYIKALEFRDVTQNNFKQFENAITEKFKLCIYNKEVNNEHFNLLFNPIATTFSVIMSNFVVELTETRRKWNNVQFTNCSFICNDDQPQIDIENLSILIDNNTTLSVDLTALIKVKIKVDTFIVRRNKIDFNQVNLIKPTKFLLYYCELNENDLIGTWNELVFYNCRFQNSRLDIQAEKVTFEQCSIVPCCLAVKSIHVSRCSICDVIKTESLYLSHTIIIMQKPNNYVNYLSLSNCTFTKFSMLNFKNLISIQTTNSVNQKIFSKFIQVKKQLNKYQIKIQTRYGHEIKRKTKKTVLNENLRIMFKKVKGYTHLIQSGLE
ncbi:Hypothetical_protein [Hexamita inflata]|uniref:Hypothetical_protein n=1 Tax=Hexamita inflata TaxID=28002 RepID=A0ABP1GGC3_9EUKA